MNLPHRIFCTIKLYQPNRQTPDSHGLPPSLSSPPKRSDTTTVDTSRLAGCIKEELHSQSTCILPHLFKSCYKNIDKITTFCSHNSMLKHDLVDTFVTTMVFCFSFYRRNRFSKVLSLCRICSFRQRTILGWVQGQTLQRRNDESPR